MEEYISGTGQKLRVHDKEKCVGRFCPIHNPSQHSMINWPTHWRDDRRIMERICPCGIGHPDPDDLAFREKLARDKDKKETGIEKEDYSYLGIHGCCSCHWEK